jgi:hypothetical protein
LKRLAGPAALLLAIAAFFWKITSGQYVWYDGGEDIALQAIPSLQMQVAALHAGKLPLWDPYHFGGEPLLGQVQPGLFNPFNYLLILPALAAGRIDIHLYSLYFVFLHAFAAIAAYLLFRDLGMAALPSWLGGLFYGAAGAGGNMGWPNVLCGMILVPLVVLFLWRAHRSESPFGNASVAGVLLGIAWYTGHHAVPMLATFATGASAVIQLFFKKDRVRRVAAYALCLIVAALISAPQIWAAMEFGRHSVRWVGLDQPIPGDARVPYAAHRDAVEPADVLNILFGGNVSPKYAYSGWLFVGITGLTLAAFAVARARTDARARVFGIIAGAALLFSLGQFNALYGIAYWLVPFMDKLREPIFALTLFSFGIAGLVALGSEVALSQEGLRFFRAAERAALTVFAITSVSFVNLRWFATLSVPEARAADVRAMDNALMLTAIASLLLSGLFVLYERKIAGKRAFYGGLVILALLEHGRVTQVPLVPVNQAKYLLQISESADLASWLRARPGVQRIDANRADLGLNLGDWYGIEQLGGYEPAVYAPLFHLAWWRPSVRRLYGVDYYIARVPAQKDQTVAYASSSGLNIFAIPGAFPRAWIVHRLVDVPAGADPGRFLDDPAFDLAHTAFMEVESAPAPLPALESCEGPESARVTERRLHSVTILVNLQCRGMVVLSDNNFPGWEAAIDGRSVPIKSAYGALRGVVAGAGMHTIRMRYRPAYIYTGGWLTLAGVVLAVFFAAREYVRRAPGVR